MGVASDPEGRGMGEGDGGGMGERPRRLAQSMEERELRAPGFGGTRVGGEGPSKKEAGHWAPPLGHRR